MSNIEQLAKLIITPEAFNKSVEFTVNSLMKDVFHPDFVKEFSWLLEGQFQKTLELAKKSIETIYTPEEINVLLELHQKYPWMTTKAEEFSQKLTTSSLAISEEITKIVFNNLESTGDLDRIVEEGFFIDQDKECFDPHESGIDEED